MRHDLCALPRVLPLIAAVSLAACALWNFLGTSYVGQVATPADARALADGMVEFVAVRLPAASSTVVLDPTPADQASNALTPAFVAALRDRGFAVADGQQADTAGAHHIRYLVTPLDSGDLVRVMIDNRAGKPHASSVRNTAGNLQAGRTVRYCPTRCAEARVDGQRAASRRRWSRALAAPASVAATTRGGRPPAETAVPIFLFVGGAMLVVAAVGYTYRDRMMQAAAGTRAAEQKKPEPASGAAVLNGAPEDGEVQPALFRPVPPNPEPQLARQQRGSSHCRAVRSRRRRSGARRRRRREKPVSRPGRRITGKSSRCRRSGSRPHSPP